MARPHSSDLPRVQFVSKPIWAPFRDGSKCLVRDLCLHLRGVEPHIMSVSDHVPGLTPPAVAHPVYQGAGGYSPGLRQNLRAAMWMLARSRADLWHFVFAPHPRASQVGSLLKTVRRVPTLQTVASPPRNFENPSRLLFGDIVVVHTRWTKDQFLGAAHGELPEIVTIPPPAPDVTPPTAEAQRGVRELLGVDSKAPLFVYPGDLEISRGAQNVVEWSRALVHEVPEARVIVAYRDKTENAVARARALEKEADPQVVRFVRNVPDILALLATSTAVLFPVEDLYGKVDLPIVLLEALRLATPVLALDEGPLRDLHGALLLGDQPQDWIDRATRLAMDSEFRERACEEARRAVREHFDASLVAKRYEELYERLLTDVGAS